MLIKNRIRWIIKEMCEILGFSSYLIWKLGFSDELDFWNSWMKTKGLQWPTGFPIRFDPELQLQDYVTELIDVPYNSEVKILDVGAGPVTILGKNWEGRKINITAVDPLAKEYNKLLKKYNLESIVETTFARAEELTMIFAENHFDLVHASNSIDHSYDPFLSIQEMLKVVKPNSFVVLSHGVNEGENSNYDGLHQWNFYMKHDNFYIEGKRKSINVTQELSKVANITSKVENNDILTKLRKL